MVKVAIAGGSSPTLGKAIVQAIQDTSTHTPIVLSRRERDHDGELKLWSGYEHGQQVQVRYVDYHDQSSLVTALQGIHTVISVVLTPDPTEWVTAQINLLHAAKEAGVKRFAPSEWAFGSRAHEKADIDRPKIEVWKEVEKSGLEATRFVCGGFMNYLGIGCPGLKHLQDEALAGFSEGPYLFNLKDGWAEVPLKADGSYPRVTMTEIGDIGRFVAAALDLDKWEDEMSMAGDTLRFDEVIKLAEEATGKKFKVIKRTKQQLQEEKDSLGPEDWIRRMECTFSMLYCDDVDDETALDPLLNRLCPDVKPIKVSEYLEKYWAEPRREEEAA